MGSKERYLSLKMLFIVLSMFVMALSGIAEGVVAVAEHSAIIRLVNSEGNPIENAKIRYATSSWYDAGLSDANGEVYISVPEKFSTITARAYYNGAYYDIKQNIRENSVIEFKTVKSIVSLKSSSGEALEGGAVKFVFSSWADYGVTDSSGQAILELLPVQYTFRMNYAEGQVDIKQNIGLNPEVAFKTIKVNVSLKDSQGNGLAGGTIKYVRASWIDYGTTDSSGNSYKELLTGTYTFRMKYEEGQVDIKQDIGQNPEVAFITSKVTVRLEDSEGNGLEGGKVRYVRASWKDFGITGSDGNAVKELLNGTYTFRMYVGTKYEDKKADVAGASQVLFVSTQAPVKTWTLTTTINPSNGGSVVVNPLKTAYTDGERVTFNVTPAQGYSFSGYGGQDGSQITANSLTMNSNKSIVILFEEINTAEEYHLNSSVQPSNSGTLTITPSKSVYLYGDTVQISASPADGFEFVELNGTGIGNSSITNLPYSFQVTGDVNCTALFKEIGAAQTIIVHNIAELNQAEITARNGNVVILLDDGTYELSDQFMVSGEHVTVRSLNGDPSKVIVKGRGMNGSVPHVFEVYSKYFTVEDLTLGWVRNHGIQVHGELDADYPVIRNVHFKDTYEQMLKVSFATSQSDVCDNGIVENCSFIYTAGIGPQWYIGGVDAHKSKGWIIRNNHFQDIKSPTSSLSEGAVHFWSDSTDTLVEKNIVVDCDRGIMFGLDNGYHHGGIIRNNFIHVTKDVGIYLANTHDAKIYNNTVFVDSNYFNAIEYRFAPTNVTISNNLTNKAIASRNSGAADLYNNVDYASDTWFEDAYSGDLHLKEALYSVVDQGIDIEGLTYDIDGDVRQSGKVDIGADEAQFELKIINSLTVEPDKTTILSNGKDQVVIKVKANYQDGSFAYINADKLIAKDSNGTERVLTSSTFQSFVTGVFKIYAVCRAYSQTGTQSAAIEDIKSPEIEITVQNQDLTQVNPTNIALLHRAGQTFVVFDEIVQIVDRASICYDDLYTLINSYPRKIKYRIYRSENPITTQNISTLTPIGTANSLSGWNLDVYGIDTKYKHEPAFRYVISKRGDADSITPSTNPANPTKTIANSTLSTPVVPAGNPLDLDQGLFVYNPSNGGSAWYAVTSVVDGVENKTVTDGANTAYVSSESVGQGEPVLQRVEFDDNFQWVYNVELYLYTRWEAPPNCSIMGKPYDYLVGKPSNMVSPAPVGIHMHCWGGNLYGGYGWWNDAEDGSLILASNQYPYDWWTGYHEKYYTPEGQSNANSFTQSQYQSGVVKPYSTNRLISFLDWMEHDGTWSIDRQRTFTAGGSMGGSGSLMMAIRYPELISWSRSWVGVHVPEKSPTFKSSYQIIYGKPEYGVLFKKDDSDAGTPVWSYYNDVWYLKNNVEKSIGFLSFSNGKNDSAIGWEQAVDFINALQETRQPHLFIWGQSGHSERTVLPKNGSERQMEIDVKVNQSLPAFTNCSLDNNYGNGQSSDGDASGQVNRYLYWETNDIVDTASSWEITAALMSSAPAGECLVDITPRRLQLFNVAQGQIVYFTNIDKSTGALVGSGEVVVDQYGLINIEQIKVSKGGNRIAVKN